MSDQALELIKTRTIFLKEGQPSGDVVLVDDGGNMYFTFLLHYVSEDNVGNTKFEVIDDFHAKMTVETKPHSFTRLSNPLQIGIYQDRSLYLDVTVEPSINSEDRTHRVTVSFYTDKEIEKGAENGTN